MTKPIAIQMEEDTHKELKVLAVMEGTTLGKMLQLLIENYKEVTNVSGDKTNA